jgi:hypothetical protein
MEPQPAYIQRLNAWRLATRDVEDTWSAWKAERGSARRSASRVHLAALAREHEAALALEEHASERPVAAAVPLAPAAP